MGLTTCSLLTINRRFGGTCRLHFQRRSKIQVRNQHEAGSKQIHVHPERRLTFNKLRGVISQKTGSLITTAVRTSNPT
jgi:hypothetical protein